MLTLHKPSHSELKEFLWEVRHSPFTYGEVGGTKDAAPAGYACGHQRVRLGVGRDTFLAAKESLRQWRMFPSEFVELIWPVPLEEGRVVATLFCAPGFWTLNPCRIVYSIDETVTAGRTSDLERFGFAYGTIGDHLASGEERFTVEYDHRDESVWYEVYCFSKADHWLSKLAYPYLRLQQSRFRRLSAKAMIEAVRKSTAEFSLAS